MSTIRKLTEKDIEDFVEISANAYCGFGTLEQMRKAYREFFPIVVNELEDDDLFGLCREEKLHGGMRLIDYKMKLLSTKAAVGGIGCVAVDLVHKKEKVAKELMEFACKYFREKGMSMAALYPFRVDFYKNMGFGYGVERRQYKIEPKYFPKDSSKKHITYLNEESKDDILDCYNSFLEKNNGMMEKTEPCLERLFRKDRKIVGYKKDGRVLGYINFSYKTKHLLKNDMVIHELIYENHEVLLELCTFLHFQADQFERIIINTPDEHIHYLVNNPENGEYEAFNSIKNEFGVSAIGLMYRVLDVRKLFKDLNSHNFNNQSCSLKLTVIDDFVKENDGSTVVEFKDGKATICNSEDYEVEVEIKVSDFSSLIMGAISFKKLAEYGLARISDEKYMNIINNIFLTDKKPMCITDF
ncbi:GNAT family N-acetyltransferase [Wukongibacter baidiensis]|uniref:GNAT family N-acetyltransferase n=1 Tax=Wukongibacter baidiensis TaxID=1723361 RepID=UPI003D7F5CB0